MKIFTLLLCASALFLTTSCATVITGTTQAVQISSVPPGAKIQVDGIDRGTTPATIMLKKGIEGQIITLKADGYQTKTFQPGTDFNVISVVNFVVPIFWAVDIVSGAMWMYEPAYYEIQLEPSGTKL